MCPRARRPPDTATADAPPEPAALVSNGETIDRRGEDIPVIFLPALVGGRFGTYLADRKMPRSYEHDNDHGLFAPQTAEMR